MIPRRVAALLAAVLPLVASAGDAVEFQFGGGQCFHHAAALPAGATLDVCGVLPAGEAAVWKFDAAEPLEFSLGPEAAPAGAARQAAASHASGTFLATAPGRYCWRFRNSGSAAVTVALELEP